MIQFSAIDYGIIAGFVVLVLFAGLYMARRASKNLESYFLGGRNLPWYFLGISGMSGWFDLTGTMIITSFLFMMGPMGFYVEFRGGAVLVLAFMLAFTGKWHRRSGCMTMAEWATYRFGTGVSGETLRGISAVMGIVSTIFMLGYLVRGATLFFGMIFPVDPVLLTVAILGLASLYTVAAGFYGVVLSDLVQGCIMIIGCIIVSIVAWQTVPSAEVLQQTAQQVTGLANWTSSYPAWTVETPEGYEAYRYLVIAALFYLLRNVFGGLASGAEPRFFAARNSREASMQCLVQGLTVMFRWPLMISFAILGIFLVARILPDAATTKRAADFIHEQSPGLTASAWHSHTGRLVHSPQPTDERTIAGLQQILGEDWQSKLLLIGPHGTVNPELVLPAVMMNALGPGVRGLIFVSLLAALMGTLSGVVNGASALFVRDIYQNFFRQRAGNRELIFSAYLASVAVVVASFYLGLAASSINDLWSWIVMGLTAGGLGPGLLRLYWWRTNAWGMSAGIFAGGLAAVMQRLFIPEMAEWMQFTLMTAISILATIAVSLATKPTPTAVVDYFYQTTRPFGWWGPFSRRLAPDVRALWRREHRNDLISSAVALVWQVTLFLVPMQVLTRNWAGVWTTLPILLAASAGLYVFWWRNLPPTDEVVADFAGQPPQHGEPGAAPARAGA